MKIAPFNLLGSQLCLYSFLVIYFTTLKIKIWDASLRSN